MRRLTLILVLPFLVVLAGCGSSSTSAPTVSTGSGTTPQPATGSTTTSSPQGQRLRVYFLRDGVVTPAARTVPATQGVALVALEELVAGPSDPERADGLTTDVPAGAPINGVTVADGRATVDFDKSFAQGAEATITPRLAQVVFTLTQFPTVHSVAFEVDGKPLEPVTGGDGTLLDHPATRADYEQLSPVILVESPLPHETVTSPLRLSGSANVFEATFDYEVRDASGKVIAKDFVTASTGAPQRGSFDVSIPLHTAAGPVTLVVYDVNQANGQRAHELTVPLALR